MSSRIYSHLFLFLSTFFLISTLPSAASALSVPLVQAGFAPCDNLPPTPAGNIVFHEEGPCPWLIRDTGFLGMSRAATLLRSTGFRVSSSPLPLADLLPNLSTRDIVVIAPKKCFSYSPADLQVFSRWVHSGGGALIMGEHEDAYGSSSLGANHLLAPASLAFTADCLALDGNAWFRATDCGSGLSAEFYAVPEISIISDSKARTITPLFSFRSGENEIFLAAGTAVGRGRIAALADSEGFLNGGGRIGISAEGNPALLIRLCSWLNQGPFKQGQVGQTMQKKIPRKAGPIKLWYLEGFGCLPPDHSVDGTGRFLKFLESSGVAVTVSCEPPPGGFDLTMIVCPAVEIPRDLADKVTSKPAILAGDAWTRLDDFTDNGIFLANLGMSDNEEYPLNLLAAKYEASITCLALYDPANQLHPTEVQAFSDGKGEGAVQNSVTLYRAVAVKGGNGFTPLLSCPPGTLGCVASFGLDERVPFTPGMTLTHYDNADVHPENVGQPAYEAGLARDARATGGSSPPPPYHAALASSKCLVAGDAELFCGAAGRRSGHRLFWQKTAGWIHRLGVRKK